MWQFCETVSSGSVLIRDHAGKEHSFVGNFTNVEIDVVKDDVVIVEGRIAFFIMKKGKRNIKICKSVPSCIVPQPAKPRTMVRQPHPLSAGNVTIRK